MPKPPSHNYDKSLPWNPSLALWEKDDGLVRLGRTASGASHDQNGSVVGDSLFVGKAYVFHWEKSPFFDGPTHTALNI